MSISHPGVVRTQGEYADGRKILYIAVRRENAEGLPFREGGRVTISLEIAGDTYTAGLRTTPKQPIVYVSSNLLDERLNRVSLAAALERGRIHHKDRVLLVRHNDRYRIERTKQ